MMKALSIQQPWAYLIQTGQKTLEIRVRKTNYRGDIVICSSLQIARFAKKTEQTPDGRWYVHEKGNTENGDYMHLGKALFIAELYDCTPFDKKHEAYSLVTHAPGYFAWHLRNIREIDPVPVKGALGLFDYEKAIII